MNLSAVLLAGGESRRMGQDKATVELYGKPLWQIQLDLLRKLRPAEILISARTDPEWRPNDIPFVADESPSRGPLSGIAATLQRIRAPHFLLLAIDMPFMTEEHLRFLCLQIAPGCGILPVIDDRVEPLAAIYPAEIGEEIRASLAGTDFSMRTLTNQLVESDKLRVVQIPVNEKNFYQNLNQPSDVA